MSELKPCPLCGCEADYFYSDGIDFSFFSPVRTPNTKHVTVRCRNCFCGVGCYKDEQRALETWNRRPEPANVPLTLDELRGMDGESAWVNEFGHCIVSINDDDFKDAVWKAGGCYLPIECAVNRGAYRHKPDQPEQPTQPVPPEYSHIVQRFNKKE